MPYVSVDEKRFLDAIRTLNNGLAASVTSTLKAGLTSGPSDAAGGAGIVDGDTQRVTLADNDPAVVLLDQILLKLTDIDNRLAGILDHLQNATTQVTVV